MKALFARLISHQPAILFSHNKPATSNQPAVLFSQNKSAPVISHQPTEQAGKQEKLSVPRCSSSIFFSQNFLLCEKDLVLCIMAYGLTDVF
jgi:hypothetical protein